MKQAITESRCRQAVGSLFPLDLVCPTCRVESGLCETRTGTTAVIHRARLDLAILLVGQDSDAPALSDS
jgi:hypothetical protein